MNTFSPANVVGIAASFCSGVVFRTTLKSLLIGAAPINPIVSFIGINAISLVLENHVSRAASSSVQEMIDVYKKTSQKVSEQEEA